MKRIKKQDKKLNTRYPKSISAQGLLNLAKMAKNISSDPGEPTDVSFNTAKYAFNK